MSWARKADNHHARHYDQLVDATDPDKTAIFCTTSGTTSKPKIALLSGGPLC